MYICDVMSHLITIRYSNITSVAIIRQFHGENNVCSNLYLKPPHPNKFFEKPVWLFTISIGLLKSLFSSSLCHSVF